MITIKVGGKPLYIPKDTTLVLEQNNNSFDIDNITSDIIWTFDIPGKPNAVALNHAQYNNVSNYKRYRCEIIFGGIVISYGYLFVQSVSNERNISCGVVLDGLGEDFGNRKLRENDYGDDVQISPLTATLEQHRANWLNFLTGSLAADSIYKFFLFACERFYKNNEAYGYHQNQWSTLANTGHDEKQWAKYINRLFTQVITRFPEADETVLNTSDDIENGLKLFNTLSNNTDKLNGYGFAPALRLDWLVRKVFENAGYRVTGDFLSNEYIKKLYLQSMNAMDGDMTQFGVDEYLYLTNAAGITPATLPQYYLSVGIDEIPYPGFQLKSGQKPVFNFRLCADVDSLITGQTITPTAEDPWNKQDEVFMLYIRSSEAVANNEYPRYRAVLNHNAAVKDYVYGYGRNAQINTKMVYYDNNYYEYITGTGALATNTNVTPDPDLYCIQLTPSVGDQCNYNDPEHAVDILGNYTAGQLLTQGNPMKKYVVELAKFRVKSVQHGAFDGNWSATFPATIVTSGYTSYIRIQYYGQLDYLEYIESIEKTELAFTNTAMNVFDTMLRWKQHVPNVSNGDFIKKLCRFFGLSMYINPFHKEVQLSFINNVFEAGAVDITDYVTESERMTYDPKQYHITAATVLSTKDTAEDFRMPDVMKRADLDAARSKKRMSVFVTNENAYNIATQDEKTKKYTWETNAGNDHSLVIGDDGDDKEEVTADILVPNMKVVDTEGTAKYICDIEANGNSKLMDDDYTGDFDMILQQYKGRRFLAIGGRTFGEYRIEDANPTCYDKDGNPSDDYLTLAATGKNSVGEKFLRRFYEFQADRENFRFTAHLPVDVFWKVYNMQLPQTGRGATETRWIMVKNRRYIPTKVSYEFGKSDRVLATIECARRHYE